MKNLKTFFSIVFFLSTLIGVSQTNHTEESVTIALKQSFVEFVENVKPAYSEGDSYKEFKDKVFFGLNKPPGYTLPPIPAEGQNLLKATFEALAAKYSSKQLLANADYKVVGKAILYINRYSKDQRTSTQQAETALFGGDGQILENNILLNSNRGACKWWQLWCHLEQIFGGPGGGQILQALINIIINIL